MSKHITLLLSDEAEQTLNDYMEAHDYNRNKAINELIILGNMNDDTQVSKTLRQLMKASKVIYNTAKSIYTDLNK